MQYNKIPIVMRQFNPFGMPKKILKQQQQQQLYFEKSRPFTAESFTGYISVPIWITIMSKLEIFQN